VPDGTNPYGLRHGAGNVCERVEDVMDPTMSHVPNDGSPNTVVHPDYGNFRISKGGSFRATFEFMRASFRHAAHKSRLQVMKLDICIADFIGFRCPRFLDESSGRSL
jgi:formylglycine-generating enzyme required for sulfatase activity